MANVTIFGTGNMGTAIADVLTAGGSTVDHIGHARPAVDRKTVTSCLSAVSRCGFEGDGGQVLWISSLAKPSSSSAIR